MALVVGDDQRVADDRAERDGEHCEVIRVDLPVEVRDVHVEALAQVQGVLLVEQVGPGSSGIFRERPRLEVDRVASRPVARVVRGEAFARRGYDRVGPLRVGGAVGSVGRVVVSRDRAPGRVVRGRGVVGVLGRVLDDEGAAHVLAVVVGGLQEIVEWRRASRGRVVFVR